MRDALSARASEVRPNPPGYRQLSATWRRRERKRRLILAILTALIFAAADAVGLWALNQAEPDTHVIFSDSPVVHQPIDRVGQP